MQSELGSTRALACSDRRLAGRNGGAIQSLNGDPFESPDVIGEGADHCTRGRVRSPSQPHYYGLERLPQPVEAQRPSDTVGDAHDGAVVHRHLFDDRPGGVGFAKRGR